MGGVILLSPALKNVKCAISKKILDLTKRIYKNI